MASADFLLKVCVLGASRSGKTLLCRTLAEQPLLSDYQPTTAVRIQELGRQLGQDHLKVQLWDVSGSHQYQHFWEMLSKDVDGVLLVIDPDQPTQEKELEQFYVNFAQPSSLTMKQCLVLGLSAASHDQQGNAGWTGLTGKLKKLPSGIIHINTNARDLGQKAASALLDKLLAGCLAQKKDKLEKAVMGE